jgi:hypothetical protein
VFEAVAYAFEVFRVYERRPHVCEVVLGLFKVVLGPEAVPLEAGCAESVPSPVSAAEHCNPPPFPSLLCTTVYGY